MISISKNILNVLTTAELTTEEVAEKIGIDKEKLWKYISTLKKKGKIIKINDKKPYIYKSITPEALLLKLYVFMSNEKKCELKNMTESDIQLLELIKEAIKQWIY